MPEPKTDEQIATEKALESKQKELEAANKRVENAEKKFNEWSNELGEIRKDRDALKETLADAQKIIAELKETPRKIVEPTKEKESEVDFETIEKSLSDEQRKTGEERFNALTQTEKLSYDSDPKFKLAFLKRLQEVAPIVPNSPWKTVPKKKQTSDGSGYDEILDRVFNRKKQTSFVPPGSTGGVTRMSGGESARKEPQEDTRVR